MAQALAGKPIRITLGMVEEQLRLGLPVKIWM